MNTVGVIGVFLLLVPAVFGQDDVTDPISCYFCFGKEGNSSCADPFDEIASNKIRKDVCVDGICSDECKNGVCVKWTHYVDGVLMIERTCSARMQLNIMMIDGVCRTESFGNGYLCMCGKHLCNSGHSNSRLSMTQTLTAIFLGLITYILRRVL